MLAPPPLIPSVLLVDPDGAAASALCHYLAGFGIQAQVAADLAAMRACLVSQRIDLLVLDLLLLDAGLPQLAAGRCAQPGGSANQLPVIALGAQAQLLDRVLAPELGADDFLAKPVEPRELVARIRAVLRRSRPVLASACARAGPTAVATAVITSKPQGPAPGAPPLASVANATTLNFSGWTLDTQDRRLWAPSGRSSALPDAEFRLLSVLLQSPRRVCSRQQLASQARGRTLGRCERSIDLLVSRLRQRLMDGGRLPGLIKTVRGAGYLLDVEAPRRGFTATAFTAVLPAAGSAAGFAA